MIDQKKLEELHPRERLKRLKELEEKNKQEIMQIETLIKKSEMEIKTDEIAEKVTPSPREVNIANLFRSEPDDLEAEIRKPSAESGEPDGVYAKQQAYNDYQSLVELMPYAQNKALREDHMQILDEISARLGKYDTESDKVTKILVASKEVLSKIKRYAGLE